jgi:cell division protein ZapA (FtsZ GTPase activity inhibitor)
MNKVTTVQVVIHGTPLNFKTDDPDYIRELADFLEEQISKIESSRTVTSPTKAVTLAAFNIADELFRLRKEKKEMSKKLSERLDLMLDMADKAYGTTGLPTDDSHG